MQLDIFNDSRDVMLRNDVIAALEHRDADGARPAWRALASEFPGDSSLAPLDVLAKTLEPTSVAPFTDHAALRAARMALDERIEPAAARVFGASVAATWTAPLWRSLANRAAPIAFDVAHPDDHAAPLWLRAGDFAAAAVAAGRVESWRRIPTPLGWMTEARHRADGLNAAWPLWVELVWLAPARFNALARRIDDPQFEPRRRRFDAQFEGEGSVVDLAWWPAWLLTDEPALARWLEGAQPQRHTAPETGFRVLLELLGLERQGRHRDVIERRKTLRDLNASLYQNYLRTR